jgi:hypothetical protein
MAKYAQVENGIVVNISVCEADLAAERGLILATADTEIGGTYDGSAFARKVVTDNRTDAQKENDARSERDGWLKYCDWTVMPDSPLSDSDKTAWQTYRQALRDVPAQAGFPDNITWPTKPEAN